MHTYAASSIAILADDLTSAADGAAPFVARGMGASIGRGQLPATNTQVVAIDSGSRSLSSAQAAARVADLTAKISARAFLYKTVDSTLRGHVAVEMEASFRASCRKTLVFAPAFPAAGRTTVGGVQYVDGVRVSESRYANDPVHPARVCVLADLVPQSIEGALILNAATQEELDAKVAAIPAPETVLWIGSPGMAAALARRIAQHAEPAATSTVAGERGFGEVLVVVGSANPLSHRQAERISDVCGVTVLRSPVARAPNPAALLQTIAADAAQRFFAQSIDLLVATGGDTMEAVLDLLDIREFEIAEELEAGFPLGRAVAKNGRVLHLAMKAGGFGDDETLQRAIAQLRQATPRKQGAKP